MSAVVEDHGSLTMLKLISQDIARMIEMKCRDVAKPNDDSKLAVVVVIPKHYGEVFNRCNLPREIFVSLEEQ